MPAHVARFSLKWFAAATTKLAIGTTAIGMLALVVYPQVRDGASRINRVAAQQILIQNAQLLESNYAMAHRYDSVKQEGRKVAPALIAKSPLDALPGNEKYNIAVTYDRFHKYVLTATPTTPDDPCGRLVLTGTGLQAADGGRGKCW